MQQFALIPRKVLISALPNCRSLQGGGGTTVPIVPGGLEAAG
ncbi:MAG TPA: hypothetical protein VK066_12595 [Chloroflexota bacterium]|nr:hypothetical protein [Chloroflexota bacterium]